ncbi:uncharacterized protein LOC135829047 [Sycon ciliatum]|uniref:uncharacterized protein LOC135829047 n=1 Tax=Sycon ciliatum TaxID=27933 RepID=UPI0031F6E109
MAAMLHALLTLLNALLAISLSTAETRDCSLPVIAGANMSEDTYYPGQNATVQCLPGFVLQGISQLLCDSSAQWSTALPKCLDVNECATSLYNCSGNSTCNNTLGSYTCECNDGFFGNGSVCKVTCGILPSGAWTYRTLKTFRGQLYVTPGQYIWQYCSGFLVNVDGYNRRKCQDNGRYDVSAPRCFRQCNPRIHIYWSENSPPGTLLITYLAPNFTNLLNLFPYYSRAADLDAYLTVLGNGTGNLSIITRSESTGLLTPWVWSYFDLTILQRSTKWGTCLQYAEIYFRTAPRVTPVFNMSAEIVLSSAPFYMIELENFTVSVSPPATDLSSFNICYSSNPSLITNFNLEKFGNSSDLSLVLTADLAALSAKIEMELTMTLSICVTDNALGKENSYRWNNIVAWHNAETKQNISLQFRKEESCPRVRPIGNGKLQPGDMVTEAETITLVCDPGYAIAGNAKTVCGANRAYSAPLGKCRKPPSATMQAQFTVIEGSRVRIPCLVSGDAPVAISWHDKNDDIIIHSRNYRIDGIQNTITIMSVKYGKDQGSISCTALNKEISNTTLRTSKASTFLDVKVPATIDPGLAAATSAFVGSTLSIPCFFAGVPQPRATWCQLGTDGTCQSKPPQGDTCPSLSSVLSADNTSLVMVINDIQQCHAGRYQCSAVNDINSSLAVSLSTIKLTVLDASQFEVTARFVGSQLAVGISTSAAKDLVAQTLKSLVSSSGHKSQVESSDITILQTSASRVKAKAEITLSSTLIQEIKGNQSLTNSLRLYLLQNVNSSRSQPLMMQTTSLNVVSFDTCPEELMTGFQGTLLWPETFGGTSALLDCPVALDDRKVEFATRDCVAHSLPDSAGGTIPRWSSPNTTTCPSPLTKELHKLSKLDFNKIDLAELVDSTTLIANVTQDSTFLSEDDVDFAATTLLNLVTVTSGDQRLNATVEIQVADAVLKSVDNILNVPAEKIEAVSASKIAHSMEKLVTSLNVEDGTTLQRVTDNVGFAISCPLNLTTQGFRTAEENGTETFLVGTPAKPALENDLDVAIDIPSQALLLAKESKEGVGNDMTACSLTQSQFILYQTSSLFQDSSIGDNTSIGSLIISAQAGDSPLENLSQPVLMSFNVSKAKTGGEYEYNLTCAFWDFSLAYGEGGWSGEGCDLLNASGDHAVCQCNHLTSFAVLVSRRALHSPLPPSSTAERSLSIISYIGCGLSMIGLLGTIVVILRLKKLRSRNHQKLMFGLCITLFLALLLFVSAVAPAAWSKGLCQAVALVLHALLLMAFMWMSADATLLYTQLVIVFGGQAATLLRNLLILIFSVPVLVVLVTAASTHMTAYGNENFCWISNDAAFYGAFIAPMTLTLIYNAVVLFAVIRSLKKRSQNVKTARRKQETSGKLYLLRITVSLSLMLGLTWVFGVLTVVVDHISVQYIFAILNTLQGLFIFVHTVRSKDVRKEWSESMSRKSGRDGSTMFSSSFRFQGTLQRIADFGDSTLGKVRSVYRSGFGRQEPQYGSGAPTLGTTSFKGSTLESCTMHESSADTSAVIPNTILDHSMSFMADNTPAAVCAPLESNPVHQTEDSATTSFSLNENQKKG